LSQLIQVQKSDNPRHWVNWFKCRKVTILIVFLCLNSTFQTVKCMTYWPVKVYMHTTITVLALA
jgi:hypothetical protein